MSIWCSSTPRRAVCALKATVQWGGSRRELRLRVIYAARGNDLAELQCSSAGRATARCSRRSPRYLLWMLISPWEKTLLKSHLTCKATPTLRHASQPTVAFLAVHGVIVLVSLPIDLLLSSFSGRKRDACSRLLGVPFTPIAREVATGLFPSLEARTIHEPQISAYYRTTRSFGIPIQNKRLSSRSSPEGTISLVAGAYIVCGRHCNPRLPTGAGISPQETISRPARALSVGQQI